MRPYLPGTIEAIIININSRIIRIASQGITLQMSQIKLLFFLALCAAFLGGCVTNPVTGKSDFSLVSAQEEVAMGQKQYLPSQQQQGGRYVTDPNLNAYINRVGQKLAAVSDRKNLPYEFVVLNSDVPNAWALPGGKVAINRGLLVKLQDESQLAAVLGHEIVHAAARHGAQQMSQGMLLNVGVQAVGIASRNSGYGALANAGAGLGAQAWTAQYSQGNELESDRYGMQYMVRAGYEPEGAVELQKVFVKMSESRQSSSLDTFFASHPPSQERVLANQRMAASMPSGARNKAQFQRAIAQLKRDQPAYQAYQEGSKALKNKNYSLALKKANTAIKQQSSETLFWQLKGIVLAQQNKNSEALKAFNKAVAANPEYFSPLLYRGLLGRELKKNRQAEQDLIASYRLLPTQVASYYIGDLALARGDRYTAKTYLTRTAQGGGKLGQKAQARLNQL